MDELIKAFPALGIGGILAGMMFWFYRVDSQRSIEQWKGQSDILASLIKENTTSNITLAVLVQSLHEHLIVARRLDDRRESKELGK